MSVVTLVSVGGVSSNVQWWTTLSARMFLGSATVHHARTLRFEDTTSVWVQPWMATLESRVFGHVLADVEITTMDRR